MQEQQTTLHARLETGRTEWMDTHPSPAARVRHARKLAEPGFDLSGAPARDLFENYTELSRQVTWVYYDSDLNLPVTKKVLVPLETWLRYFLPPPLPVVDARDLARV